MKKHNFRSIRSIFLTIPVIPAILWMSLVLTFFQIALALSLSPRSLGPLSEFILVPPPTGWNDCPHENHPGLHRYHRLNNWDSLRYFDVALNGYHSASTEVVTQDDMETFKTNGSFFPGYPLLSRKFSQLFNVSIQESLLVVAQIATFVFWIYFFLVLKLWGADAKTSILLSLLILAFPTSFYMVMGYSESLFLACLIGTIYWTERFASAHSKSWHGFLASLHGFGMCSTRLMGLPILAYPLLRAKVHRSAAIGICLISSLGCFLFFSYCQVKFGRWDWYMHLQKIAGGVSHQPWAVLNPLSYIPRYFFENTEMSLDRSIAPMTLIGLISAFKMDPKWQERSGLYFSILCMHYLLISSKASADFIAVARHGHTTFILFVLVFVQILFHPTLPSSSKGRLNVSWVSGVCIILFTAQVYLTYRFVHGRWVE